MADVCFSLDFFAERIQTEPERLSYCIIQRTYHNPEYGCLRIPGLRVDGINEYAYSLAEGYFVRLGETFSDSVITMESAEITPAEDGYIFRTVSGIEEFFSLKDLIRVWYTRIVNDQLK